jgi:hypothetical protein
MLKEPCLVFSTVPTKKIHTLATNDPQTTVEEARTFRIGVAGVSPENAQALVDCLVRLGLLDS